MERVVRKPEATRLTHRVAAGCLALLILPTAALAYFWYSVWHASHINEERREEAVADVVRKVRSEASRVGESLNNRNAGGADAVDVIWQETKAPVIQHEASREQFTTYINRSAVYTELGVVLGGGPVKIDRCFVVSYRQSASGWATSTQSAGDSRCERGTRVAQAVDSALTRLQLTAASGLTDSEILQAFDFTSRVWHTAYRLRHTHRDGSRTRITVLLRGADTDSGSSANQQCYRFDIATPDGPTDRPHQHVTARPILDSTCAQT